MVFVGDGPDEVLIKRSQARDERVVVAGDERSEPHARDQRQDDLTNRERQGDGHQRRHEGDPFARVRDARFDLLGVGERSQEQGAEPCNPSPDAAAPVHAADVPLFERA